MMAKTGIDVFGDKELEKLFKELPNDLNVKILQDINRSGAAVYKNEMQDKAPVGSDEIYKNIKIQKDKEDKTALLIGVSKKAFHARFIEFGTIVRKGRGKITPKPFVSIAIESVTDKVTKTIFDEMGKRVHSFLKRHIKKINKR